ncbi:hypothetical protein HYY75_04500 [bacterium]|nr:hypothetical protein [bacterium]
MRIFRIVKSTSFLCLMGVMIITFSGCEVGSSVSEIVQKVFKGLGGKSSSSKGSSAPDAPPNIPQITPPEPTGGTSKGGQGKQGIEKTPANKRAGVISPNPFEETPVFENQTSGRRPVSGSNKPADKAQKPDEKLKFDIQQKYGIRLLNSVGETNPLRDGGTLNIAAGTWRIDQLQTISSVLATLPDSFRNATTVLKASSRITDSK